ncbi:MAG: LysM peptidoglycan-binding domain-containing protein [Dehalococcoidia bacterium]
MASQSPWIPPQRPPAERPWLGMALLVALPLLSLALARMLWSGSSLWFLAIGILFLLAAGVVFLNRRQQALEFEKHMLNEEAARGPLVLAGLGVLFLALLLLPNYSGGGSDAGGVTQQPGADTATGEVLDSTQPPAQPTAQVQEQAPADTSNDTPADTSSDDTSTGSGDTYVVQSGDSLWSIAEQHDTTVEAIVAANSITNPAELQVGEELAIPPPEQEASAE